MDSHMVGQIEKAKQYAQEPERIKLLEVKANFEGSNHTQTVTYDQGKWHCTSHIFETRGISAYIMTVERVLADWVTPAEIQSGTYDNDVIEQVEKSRHYASEPERLHFINFKANFDGYHDNHTVSYNKGQWQCDCHSFVTRNVCSHVMAMERLLADWVERAELKAVPA